ncbi:MAG: hypothetical protein ACFFA4_06060 [Promethearchaeota archaeon]
MENLTKNLKILLIINAIIGLGFAVLYLAVSHLYLSLIHWPFYDPYYSWAFGGIFLILSIFILITLKKNQWGKCKTVFEINIAWQIMFLILNITSLIFIQAPINSIITTWIYNIIFIILIVINIKFYNKYR